MSFARHSPSERLAESLRPLIGDERVLTAVASVPRERFVPGPELEHAYDNAPLPIGCGQTISQPLVVARMCELLDLRSQDRVLDVGSGSGYHAALLARLCAHVWSIERYPELSEQAAANLQAAGVTNVTLAVGDGSLGLPEHAPYDAINVGAAAWREIPPALEEQLAPGGRLVVPVATRGYGQHLMLARRDPSGWQRQVLEAVRFVPLVPDAGDEAG